MMTEQHIRVGFFLNSTETSLATVVSQGSRSDVSTIVNVQPTEPLPLSAPTPLISPAPRHVTRYKTGRGGAGNLRKISSQVSRTGYPSTGELGFADRAKRFLFKRAFRKEI